MTISEADFRPISPNPFIVGNPVRDRAMFFGRETEFQLVRKRFADSDQGGIIVFCGERRSGKTSILFQIMQGRLGPRFLPVLIDMQSMAVEDEAEFYRKITSEIASVLGSHGEDIEQPDYRSGNRPAGMLFQEFVDALVSRFPDRKPILLIDEYELLETKIEDGALTPDVLQILAGLLERHAFFLVFTGSTNLEDRGTSVWRILGQSIHRRVSFLERSDALDLITKPLAGRVRFADESVDLLLRLGAGQPFYTQALCQNLVDLLNERCLSTVTPDLVEEVADGIVRNPFPQMIFRWETLAAWEKATLALLARDLEGPEDFATAERLMGLVRKRRYPLVVDRGVLATTLEALYAKELLAKPDDVDRGFAYRMDLWRRWVEREHSVWQVIRAEGLARRRRIPRPALAAAAVAVAGVGLLLALGPRARESPDAAVSRATLSLDPVPRDATVSLNGEVLGTGPLLRQVQPDSLHEFRLTAAGHADTTIRVQLEDGRSERMEVRMRPLTGALSVTTEPTGATIEVDGTPRGTGPLVVTDLPVTEEHAVRISYPGRVARTLRVEIFPADTTERHVVLEAELIEIAFSTAPPGAEISLGGEVRGTTPVTVTGIATGPHEISAALAGFVPLDTTIALSRSTPSVHFLLTEQPPGILTVLGAQLARRIFIDSRLHVANVHNSGPCTLSVGLHAVQVDLPDTSIQRDITIESDRHLTFDYVSGEIRSSPLTGERP